MDKFTVVPNLTATVSYQGQPTVFKKRTVWVRGMGGPNMSLWNMNPYRWNISNFAPVQVFDEYGNGGGVAMWQVLGPDTVKFVKTLQPSDGITANDKVDGYLFNKKGRPGWPDDRAGYVDLGLVVFGMNQVLVTGVKYQKTAAPDEAGGRQVREVAILQGMTKEQEGKIDAYSHPWLIHRVTCAYFPNGTVAENVASGKFKWIPSNFKYPEARLTSRNDRNAKFSAPQQEWLKMWGDVNMAGTPKGEIYVPFFHPADYPVSSGTSTKECVIPTRFLCNNKEEAEYFWRPGDPMMPSISA